MSVDTGAIRAEPHVEIGSLIEREAATLVERWCSRALAEQPVAKRVHWEVLRDQLPRYLRSMGRALSQAGDADPAQNESAAVAHGDQRWDSGWSLAALIRDYQLLKLVILEYLEETLKRPLMYREVMAVGVFIDDAVAASTVSYVASRDAYLRRAEEARATALQEASRNKDEFIATLAHELRNPLAPIANSVKVMRKLLGQAEGAVCGSLDVIERQTRILSRLADDMLDLARISQGRLQLEKAPADLATVIEQAVQTAEPALKARDHRLVVTLPQESVFLDVDATRLTQVLVNLLNNAAKYTHPGGQISVLVTREPSDVAITVRDDGIGIPPEMIGRVFEMFVQVDGATRQMQRGLGVGLALVKQVVHLHGGSVVCTSDGPGKGSEFTVRLPALAEPPRAAPPPARPAAREVPSLHLLLIEDNADARDSMATLLRLHGHRVDVAATGTGGIAQARTSPPQVALIDIGLPDVDGYEVATRLRAECGDRIFLVALTGYGQSDDVRAAAAAGFDAHLLKPTDVDQLGQLLARASNGRIAPA